MKTILFLFTTSFLLSLAQIAYSQSIPSYWINFYESEKFYFVRNKPAEKVTIHKTYLFNSGEFYELKQVFKYPSPNRIEGKTFKNGNLESRFAYEFDDQGRVIKNEVSHHVSAVGMQDMVYTHEYSGNNRICSRHYTGKGQLLRIVHFRYDSLRRMTKMVISDPDNFLISYETADYGDKTYIHRVYNSRADLVLEEEIPCNIKVAGTQKNNYGDYTKIVWPSSGNGESADHLEYKYDDFGNWYDLIYMQKSGDGEITDHYNVKRKIKYKK